MLFRSVRIFTPVREVPFAGHPNIGTAFVLASTGELGEIPSSLSVTFEEKSGLVPITIREASGKITCELKAPQAISFGKTIPAQLIASAVSLAENDLVTRTHEPQAVSVGLPFVFAELRDCEALERLRVNTKGFDAIRDILSDGIRASLYLYAQTTGEVDIHARMFAPLSGVPEDPATGSAGCAVVGLLAHLSGQVSGEYCYRIAQGVEMGRPSLLLARAEKSAGVVQATWVGGACVLVSEGFIQVA